MVIPRCRGRKGGRPDGCIHISSVRDRLTVSRARLQRWFARNILFRPPIQEALQPRQPFHSSQYGIRVFPEEDGTGYRTGSSISTLHRADLHIGRIESQGAFLQLTRSESDSAQTHQPHAIQTAQRSTAFSRRKNPRGPQRHPLAKVTTLPPIPHADLVITSLTEQLRNAIDQPG